MPSIPQTQPTILVIFGATGDVVAKKIVPALYHLYVDGHLPPLFHVIGFSRRDWSDGVFQSHVRELLKGHPSWNADIGKTEAFINLFSYHQGNFSVVEDYHRLAGDLGRRDGAWQTCANKLFYLAVPPNSYETIFQQLAASGLTIPCGEAGGWTRLLVEKPIGVDQATSLHLDDVMGSLFHERQIYRIEHYLAKEMIRNILVFRFANNLFEAIWNRDFIERVHIRLWEAIGVETRGNFYDGVGALRDVGQNHLLQMLALVSMDHPQDFDAAHVHAKRAEILSALEALDEQGICQQTYRAQYDGYQRIAGVQPDSQTETYFRVNAAIRTPRWQGVPFVLESGKRLGQARKEIEIFLRHPEPCLCPPDQHYRNRIVISLEPDEAIRIDLWSKKPGHGLEMEKRTLDFLLRAHGERQPYIEEYQKVLLDAIRGDQTLFVSTKELQAMWRFIDPIQRAWKNNLVPLHRYQPDTDEPIAASARLATMAPSEMQRRVGIIGLGKMGAGLARQWHDKGWQVVGYNRTAAVTDELVKEGIVKAPTIAELVNALPVPRIVWLMLPAGAAVDDMLFGSGRLEQLLTVGDIVIDGGNSFYKDAAPRAERLGRKGIAYADVGVSGGPSGARNGACLMIGGDQATFNYLEPLFQAAALPQAYQFFPGYGAGHFVKMVHNGIEYGMMQAMAEGFNVLRASPFSLSLINVADVYQHGSVIESRLIGWLQRAFQQHGERLDGVRGSVAHTGEGAWTVQTAHELGIAVKIIESSLAFRIQSEKHPDYAGQILSALRQQFGGHQA